MNTRRLMFSTLAALIPGAAVMTWQFGPGLLLNLAFAAGVAVSTEALVMLLRRRSPASVLDGSALLTGVLIGLALPPLLPFWILTLGVVSGLVFGKHVYGGLGQNLFNPAMVGYAVLILSFPLAMSQWPAPYSLAEEHRAAGVLRAKTGLTSDRPDYDGISRATPLDAYRFRSGKTNAEFFSGDEADNLRAWMTINLAFLVGGLFLAALRVIPWVIPAGFIATLSMLSLLFYDGGGSGSLGSPVFHLFSGATMLAAFFILTDPVTSPSINQGLIFFAIGAGMITFVIRAAGAYPEGVAFAVLLMNAAAPLIDHLLRGRRP